MIRGGTVTRGEAVTRRVPATIPGGIGRLRKAAGQNYRQDQTNQEEPSVHNIVFSFCNSYAAS